MKATVFSKAVVMMAVVMASVMNFSASAATPADYVKNEEMTAYFMHVNEEVYHLAYVIPMLCFVFCAYYGWKKYKVVD